MKNAYRKIIPGWGILSLIFLCSYPALAFETEALIPHLEVIIPGMTRTLEITQSYDFPQDFNNLFLVVLGYGGLSITLRKVDTEGDLLTMAGLGISPAGIVPMFKFGTTQVTLSEAIEIGSEYSPYGIAWIVSWVESPHHTPPYHYTLILSF